MLYIAGYLSKGECQKWLCYPVRVRSIIDNITLRCAALNFRVEVVPSRSFSQVEHSSAPTSPAPGGYSACSGGHRPYGPLGRPGGGREGTRSTRITQPALSLKPQKTKTGGSTKTAAQ